MLLVDTGPLVAAALPRDRDNAACKALLAAVPPPLLVPMLVITEVASFLGDRVGSSAEAAFAGAIAAGELVPEPVMDRDWPRIYELTTRYVDLRLGIVDASVIAAAERLDLDTIATLDRRHFTAVPPAHTDAFRLVPDLS